MAHREGIRAFLKDVKVDGVVIDWGCGTKPIQKYLKPNRAQFITIDQLGHVGADVVADIEDAELVVEFYADYAFCLEVLEHTWYSDTVLDNIYKHLNQHGVLYLSQPFMYEVHKEDDVKRYTHHGLERLLKESGFKNIHIEKTGGEDMDHAWGYVVRAEK